MGFKSVYRVLMDVFPQVDSRILRAVAIENSKDADKAVEVVLMEIIPCIASTSVSIALDNVSREESPVHSGSKNSAETVGLFEVFSRDDGEGDGGPVCGSDGKQLLSPVKLGIIIEPGQSTDGLSTFSKGDNVPSNLECLVENNLQQLCSDVNSLDTKKLSPPAVLDFPSPASENGLQQANDEVSEPTNISEHESMEENSTHELVDFKREVMEAISTGGVVEFEEEKALNTEVSQSGQTCRIDLLEDIIKEARDNKKTLFTAMESVISLMREVEVGEKAAEQAKEEAARGPWDVLASIEDLKQMLQHAREANDMHTGEVYGEKAILATEAKELQSRLLCLSDERNNSLAILDEMRQTLEDRLDAAEKAIKAAEEEKMENEERARKALAEQQLIMDKLVKESKMLKQEAEENSKLQEFLMDRGSVVDVLQGEISVICQDVKLLKQKFDERVPLGESLSSSQTSCRLASSSSSLKSLPLDQVLVQLETELETSKRTSPTPSISDHFSSVEKIEAKDCDALVDDDGWEFCDNKELNM